MAPKIERKSYPWGRAYIVEGLNETPLVLPSVTTVLKLVKNPKYEMLRQQFGETRWEKILNDSAERGNVMHKMLELFLLEWDRGRDIERSLRKAQVFAIEESRKDDGKMLRIVERGRTLFWNFYEDRFWENISEIVENEIFLYTTFKGGWAGASDFVYRDLEGNLIVEDFKSSTSPKDEQDIHHYKLQISAYMFMCAEKFNEIPKMGKIRISNEQNKDIQTFTVHDYEMKDYLKEFLALLDEFRKINQL